jgi:hypothetical protein
MTVRTPIMAHQTITRLKWIEDIRVIDFFIQEKFEEGILIFNQNHINRLRHFEHANTFIMKMVFLEHLKQDVQFAKLIYKDFGIKLELKALSKKHKDYEKAISAEIEMAVRLNQELTSNASVTKFGFSGYMKVNYMNEISVKEYFRLIDYFNAPRETERPEPLNYKAGWLEDMVAPIESILLSVSSPDYFSYKDDVYKYNDSLLGLYDNKSKI